MATDIEVAEHVVQLLETGTFTATYKQAVLIALIDLCANQADERGHPPTSVTTRQLAERVIELYWPQTRPYLRDEDDKNDGSRTNDTVLAQNQRGRDGAGQATIVSLIHDFQASITDSKSPTTTQTLTRGKANCREKYELLVHQVEWTLIDMPLPRLQRVGRQDTDWLYVIAWNDRDRRPRRSDVRAYQRHGEYAGFDNQIRFQLGVPEAFVRLAGILRPFIQQHWAAKVAALNHLNEGNLASFMFGVDRISLERVRAPLVELQSGRCFYCRKPMQGAVDVDHFVPWARQPENGLHNLVVAHQTCNAAKRDFLASSEHLQRWYQRSVGQRDALVDIARNVQWDDGQLRVPSIVRSLYLRLPSDSRLWRVGSEFETTDRQAIQRILVASVA